MVASPPLSAVVFPPTLGADSSTLSASMNSLLSKTPSLFVSAASKSRWTTPLCTSAVNTRLRSVSSASNAAAISLALVSSEPDGADDDDEKHAVDDDDALLAKSIVAVCVIGTKSTKPPRRYSLCIVQTHRAHAQAEASRAFSTGKPPSDASRVRTRDANTARVHARRIAPSSNSVVTDKVNAFTVKDLINPRRFVTTRRAIVTPRARRARRAT